MATDTATTLAPCSVQAERLLYAPADWTVIGTGTGGTVTATMAGVTNKQHFCFGLTYSLSAAPAAPITLQLKDGSTVIFQAEIPAATSAPAVWNLRHLALHASAGAALQATVGSPGTATITINMVGITVMQP